MEVAVGDAAAVKRVDRVGEGDRKREGVEDGEARVGEDLFERRSGEELGDVTDARRADDEVAGPDQDRAQPIEALGNEVLEAPLRLGAVEAVVEELEDGRCAGPRPPDEIGTALAARREGFLDGHRLPGGALDDGSGGEHGSPPGQRRPLDGDGGGCRPRGGRAEDREAEVVVADVHGAVLGGGEVGDDE